MSMRACCEAVRDVRRWEYRGLVDHCCHMFRPLPRKKRIPNSGKVTIGDAMENRREDQQRRIDYEIVNSEVFKVLLLKKFNN